jgi:hypothetical protein
MQSLQEASPAGYASITQLSETCGLSAGSSSSDTEPVADVAATNRLSTLLEAPTVDVQQISEAVVAVLAESSEMLGLSAGTSSSSTEPLADGAATNRLEERRFEIVSFKIYGGGPVIPFN